MDLKRKYDKFFNSLTIPVSILVMLLLLEFLQSPVLNFLGVLFICVSAILLIHLIVQNRLIRRHLREKKKALDKIDAMEILVDAKDKKFMQVFSNSSALMLLVDCEGVIVNANRAYLAAMNIDRLEIVGKNVFESGQGDAKEVFKQYVKLAFAEPFKSFTVDFWLTNSIYVTSSFQVYKNGTYGLLFSATNITEQLQLLHKHQLQLKKYDFYLSTIRDGVWCFEPETPIPPDLTEDEKIETVFNSICKDCNIQYVRMLGYENVEDVQGKRMHDLMVKTEETIDYLQTVIDSGSVLNIETIEKTSDGEQKYYETCLYAEYNSQKELIRIWGNQKDISDRKRNEKQIRINEYKFRNISENVADIVFELDADRRITFVNQNATRICGYHIDELEGEDIRNFIVDAAAKESIMSEVRDRIKQRSKKPVIMTVPILKKNGTIGMFEVQERIEFDHTGRLSGFFGIARDVTDEVRKRMDEDFQKRKVQRVVLGRIEAAELMLHSMTGGVN